MAKTRSRLTGFATASIISFHLLRLRLGLPKTGIRLAIQESSIREGRLGVIFRSASSSVGVQVWGGEVPA